MFIKIPVVLHQTGLLDKLGSLSPSHYKMSRCEHHSSDKHVGVDQVVVHHNHRLLEFSFRVQDGIHLPAGVEAELNNLAQQIKGTLDGFLVPKKITFKFLSIMNGLMDVIDKEGNQTEENILNYHLEDKTFIKKSYIKKCI